MLYLMKPGSRRHSHTIGVDHKWTDREETLGRRHLTIATLHFMLVMGLAWSLILSCL